MAAEARFGLLRSRNKNLYYGLLGYDAVDVDGFVYYNTNSIEITNKMRPCSRIYYSDIS
jgi:hypothetical protein